MPLQEIEQRIKLTVDANAPGLKGIQKQLAAFQKQNAKLVKVYQKLAKEFVKREKSVRKSIKLDASMMKGQARLAAQMDKATSRIKKQRMETNRAVSANNRFGLSLRGLAGIAATIGLTRRFSEGARRDIESALVASPKIFQRVNPVAGIADDKIVEAVTKVLGSAPSLRFGASDSQIQGIVKALENNRGFIDKVPKLLTDFIGTLETSNRGAFLDAINSSGLKAAVERFGNNLASVDIATSLSNLAETQQRANAGTLPPILETTVKLNEAFESLDSVVRDITKTIATVVLPLLRKFTALDPKSQRNLILGAGAAGVVGSLGVGKLITNSIGKAVATATGASAGASTGAATGSGLLAGIGGGLALAAPLVAGEEILRRSLNKTSDDLQRLLNEGPNRLADLARSSPADTERDRLVKRRRKLEATLAGFRPAGTESNFLLGQVPSGQFTSQQQEQIKSIRDSIRTVQLQIKTVGGATRTQKENTEAVKQAIKVNKQAPKLRPKAPTLTDAQERAIALDATRLPSQLGSSELATLRAQRATAQIGPFGSIGSFGETVRLSEGIDRQISILQEQAKLMMDGTNQGRINANLVIAGIENLKAEQKSNTQQLVNSFLNSSIQQAFGSIGRFEKIIINSQKNLGLGLRSGSLGLPGLDPRIERSIVGSVDPIRMPRQSITPQQVLRASKGSSFSGVGNDPAKLLMDTADNMRRGAKNLERAATGMTDVVDNQLTTEYASNRLGSVMP
jgi:hypothetical protein